MNLFLLFFPTVAVLIAARIWSTPVLFAGWSFLITAMPILRGSVGPIPIYAYDVAAILVWSVLLMRTRSSWPRAAPPWAPLIIFIMGLFGTLIPMAAYGAGFAEMIWNFGHVTLAYAALVAGAFLINAATAREREGFRLGLAVGLIGLAAIAVLQKSSPEMNTMIIQMVLGASEDSDGPQANYLRIAELLSAGGRVAGPFGSPNTFGVVATVAALNYWLLTTYSKRRSKLDMLVMVSLIAVLIASASRQALLAMLIVVAAFIVQTSSAAMVLRLIVGGVIAGSAAVIFGADIYLERMLRLLEGTGEANIAARLYLGPQRLLDMVSADPLLLLTGVGLEIQKLYRLGLPIPANIIGGFVSNGFLLYIYYFGIAGFLVMASFWLWVLNRAMQVTVAIRRVTLGSCLAFVFIVFADNHAVLAEELITQMMVFVGGMTAISYQIARQRRVERAAMTPAAGEVHAYSAGK